MSGDMIQVDLQGTIQAQVGPMGGVVLPGGIGRLPGGFRGPHSVLGYTSGLWLAGSPSPNQFDQFTAASSVGPISALITRSARSWAHFMTEDPQGTSYSREFVESLVEVTQFAT